MPILKTQTWSDVETYLKKSQAIIIPIGSFEQHGPNGYIGTDIICPEVIANAVSDEIDIMVGPSISVGIAQHHLGFAGSITLRPSTLIAVMKDMINSLALHGFSQFLFLNGHGGNIATVNAAFAEIWSESSFGTANPHRPKLEMHLFNWFMGKNFTKYSKAHFGDEEGYHATPSEVSITFEAYPENIKDIKLSPLPAMHHDDVHIRDAQDYREQFPDGRIAANPGLSTREHGKALIDIGKQDCIAELKRLGMLGV